MLARLRHYLSAAYLLSPAPYAEAAPISGHLFWALALLGISVLAIVRWRQTATDRAQVRAAWAAVAWASTLSALALAWQLAGAGPLSARIWAVGGSGVTLYLLLAALCRQRAGAPRMTAWRAACLAGTHLLGLGLALWQAPTGWPVAGLALLVFLSAGLGAMPGCTRRWALAPLFLLYAATITRLALAWLGSDLAAYAGAPYPNLLSAWLHPTAPLLAAGGWCWLRAMLNSRGRWRKVFCLALPLAFLGWYFGIITRHLSVGVTGSDPYGYVQMALDLLAHGSPQHWYPLAVLAEHLGLATWPTVPVGYNPPVNGWALAVWPPGWPALLALAAWGGGERAMLWLAPLCHLGAAALAGLLGGELARPRGRTAQYVIGGLAAGLLLTSYEGIVRSLVPMADAAAGLGGAAMCLLLVRALRRDRLGLSLAAGALWGATFAIRHPQLALGLGGLCLLLTPDRRWPRRLAHLGLFGLGAIVAAAPDLAFHTAALGAPWRVESREWFLLSLANIPHIWHALWQDGWWRLNEWGYLWPWMVAGLLYTWRHRQMRLAALALLLGYGGCLLFHLCYGALRLRDLTPLFAWLAVLTAVGAWATWRHARAHWPRQVQGLVAAVLALSLAARTADTLWLPGQARVWVFGYVRSGERAGLASLGTLTPDGAVIATGLNAGAVQLYAGRETIRPASWSADEFAQMTAALAQAGRPLYVLDDGAEMAAWIARGLVPLQKVATLELPRMGLGGQHEEGPGILYRAAP